jgi:hypothetical protein
MEEKESASPTGLPRIRIITDGDDCTKTRVYLDDKEITGCLQSVSFKLEAGILYPIVTLAMYVDPVDVDVAAKIEKVDPLA